MDRLSRLSKKEKMAMTKTMALIIWIHSTLQCRSVVSQNLHIDCLGGM